MNITFIGQGYNQKIDTSVSKVLIDSLKDKKFHTFSCLVAFASYSGISGLTDHIVSSKEHIKKFRIIIGVDQNATSKEALEEILVWDVESYVFYSTQRNIFHPKLYLFEGDEEITVIIGSNNLTMMGLVQNIEGAVQISFKRGELDAEDLQVQIYKYFDPLLTGNSENLQVLSKELIDHLLAGGVITTEEIRRTIFTKEIDVDSEGEAVDEEKVNKIKELFPTIALQKLPDDFKPKKIAQAAQINPIPVGVVPTPVVISNASWGYTDNSEVLIAEIGGPSRWKQISFAKDNFETFFELPTNVGTSGQINLRYLENDGTVENNTEPCISARVKESRNFNLEPLKVRESTINYDRNNRPIILFIKINSTNFVYHLESNGSQFYNELSAFLPASGGLRRLISTVNDVKNNCPNHML